MFHYIKNWFYNLYIKWISDIENQYDASNRSSLSLSEDGVLELVRAINRE